MTETSNLLQYSPEQLSLLVKGIDLKIKQDKEFVSETKRWGKDFVKLHKEMIKALSKEIDELYDLRIAICTVHQAVTKRESIILN